MFSSNIIIKVGLDPIELDPHVGWEDVSGREGDIMHEIMHSLGILHMHNRNDRDDYIRVISSSVQEALQGDYEKSSADNVINYTPYEYGSIMHYSARAGTKPDHGDTNIPADPPGCGATLEASSHWKTEKFTFKDSNVRRDEDQGYKVCNHWIQAPLGKQIEIRVIGMPLFMCKYGCPAYAIEPKILSDKRITNPR
ncbi:astacin [Teladorsagia circumcincta]|uniref:Metalloendopeptidase n=1 Tax=Teladorsagia circumcincta TaxID=45464 RepID=A0A2G9UDE3_TELCI|nr:astacin [Teladorsagia circumcincta]